MSLLGQSQQLFPTSVRVTVHQARNLRVKGKNGTNDAYAIIQVAKDKFSTSVAEKCVAPVWKEEASFDLPLFHPENADRCTLYIIVMHRAQVGLDKFLGQAVINLLDLYDNKSRNKTEWFKLVNKDKKEDKVRGEVQLDVNFMRNNMSASMFDLSMHDKPRSRISKLKDKVRGKKKDGFSDSASAIVPSVSQVLTDSEGEPDTQSLNQSPEVKKKSKLKTLFAPKSNLQRNMSQSMFTLGTLPEKNSSVSSSRSSGLNVDSPEGKKKFKLLGHKRTGSSDSKVSLGGFSLLGRSKQSNSDQNNLCINGNHVYTEEAESRSGSTLSLNTSEQGSAEDVRKHAPLGFAESVPVPSFRPESTDKAVVEQQRPQGEEKRRVAEEKRMAEAKRLEEEERYKAEAKRLQEEEQRRQQEEQERRRHFIENEASRKKQKEAEEEGRRRQDEERRMLEAAENQRLEEERRRAEEQKRQEEASMSDRLTSLFGMIRKKEEKKDEAQQQTKEEQKPSPALQAESKRTVQPVSSHSTNPFEDIPLSSHSPPATNQSPSDHLQSSRNPQPPAATMFLSRTPKVSAVKPRSAQTLESEPAASQTPSPSSAQSESTLSSVPSESPDTFSNLHSSLAPPHISQDLLGSPGSSTEDLSGSPPTMADQKKRALLPPSYPVNEAQSRGDPVREIQNPVYVEEDGSQQTKRTSVPLPAYESLFPKRHGVQGQIRWDNIVAEVNQKHRFSTPELMGPEMSVDGPEEHKPSPRSSTSQENPATRKKEIRPVSTKKVAAPLPPKSVSPVPRSFIDSNLKQGQSTPPRSLPRPNSSSVPKSDSSPSGTLRDREKKTSSRAASPSLVSVNTTPSDDQRKAQVSVDKEAPTAKPRQRLSGVELTRQEESTGKTDGRPLSSSRESSVDKKENFAQPSQIPKTDIPKGSLGHLNHNKEVKVFSKVQTEQKSEQREPTADDLDTTFNQERTTDPFDRRSSNDSLKRSQNRKNEDDSKQLSPAFQRANSQRGKRILPGTNRAENKTFMLEEEPEFKEAISSAIANQVSSTRDVPDTSVTAQPQPAGRPEASAYAGDDPTRAPHFYVPSSLAPSGPLPVVLEEPAAQTEKTPLRAWVSPSEVQPVSTQSSNGSVLRRPHPVKPLSPADSQHATSSPAVKDLKVWDTTLGKTKGGGPGPYSQLTQEELVSLVVKQQTDLSKKDGKIAELEEYIDNLLVRVIEEKPSILSTLKPM